MFVDSWPVRRYRPKNIIPPSQWYQPKSNFTFSLNTLFTGSMDILPGIKSVSELEVSDIEERLLECRPDFNTFIIKYDYILVLLYGNIEVNNATFVEYIREILDAA